MSQKVHEIVTERILEQLDKGVVPWHKPWNTAGTLPVNIRTKNPYRGSNIFLLAGAAAELGVTSRWWGTWKAWKEKKGTVLEEEQKRSGIVVFFKFIDVVEEDDDGEEVVIGQRPLLRYYHVWNLDQVEGVKDPDADLEPNNAEFTPIEHIEKILGYYHDTLGGPRVEWGGHEAAYYPSLDKIRIPKPEDFIAGERYYSTWFHEEIHGTGHPDRLNRPGVADFDMFGSDQYAFEELVAEMGSAILSQIVGIEEETIEHSAGYIENWRQKLSDEPRWIVKAGSTAQKAVDHILGTTWEN